MLAILDAAQRLDPTGTRDIRARFAAEMNRRWTQLKMLVRRAIVEEDFFSLGPVTNVGSIGSPDPVREFQLWLDTALNRVVTSGDGSWTQHYLDEAAARARSRAYRLAPAPGGVPTDRHNVVASIAAVELQGVVEAVSQQAVREAANGLLRKLPRGAIAMLISQRIMAVGKTRSRALVNLSINQAFNSATLDVFKSIGLKRVGVQAERVPRTVARDKGGPGSRSGREETPSGSTIGRIEKAASKVESLEVVEILLGSDPCPVCEDISDGGPYEIDEANGLIPAHPNCECAFVPYFDSRFAEREDEG